MRRLYSLKHKDNVAVPTEWSRKYLFDLWILNLADIIVSVEEKYNTQNCWMDSSQAQKRIENFFFESPQASVLLHDLRVSFKLLEFHNKDVHTDNTASLTGEALKYTERHVIERMRRLIHTSMVKPLTKYKQDPKDFVDSIRSYLCKRENINATLLRAIQSVGNFQDFCNRFSYIGSMDYALSFFEKIASMALKKVCNEISEKSKLPTYWIRNLNDKPLGKGPGVEKALWKVQGKFFMDNYTATLIQIMSHLLFRERCIDSLRNLEFSDASNRLTDEKLESIIALEGPFRAKRSTQLILQTIFYW